MSSLGIHGATGGGTGTGGDVNIAEYGGVSTSLGQKTMAASIPVTIASDQTGFSGGQTDSEARAYQTATGTITASGQSVILALDGATGASVNFIDSSFNGTFKFYSSVDGGVTYIETQAYNIYGATGGQTISNSFHTGISGFRIWNFVLVGGETHVKVNAESGSSGSCAVTISANNGSPNVVGLAICPSTDDDYGRPVGGFVPMARQGTTGLRAFRTVSNRYEAGGSVASLLTMARIPTTNTSSMTSVNDTASSTTLLVQNTARMQAFITNTSSAVLFIRLGSDAAASATAFTKRLAQWETWEVPMHWIGIITGIWASDPNDGIAVIHEITGG